MFGSFFDRKVSEIPSEYTPIIKAEIQQIRGPKKPHANGTFIVCPFHADHSPSLLVNTVPTARGSVGTFYCFGCGEKGNWNKLAKKLNLTQIDIDNREYIPPIQSEDSSALTLEKVANSVLTVEVARDWRGIDNRLLQDIGAKELLLKDDSQLFLPVVVYGDVIGGVQAVWTKKKGVVSYMNTPGEWSKTKGLFPFDFIRTRSKKDFVVMVEGPRDALAMIQQGIPALSILGSTSWSRQKRELLLSLEKDRIFLLMDSDDAGQKASAMLLSSLTPHITVTEISLKKVAKKLRKPLDPASLPESLVQHLKEKYFS